MNHDHEFVQSMKWLFKNIDHFTIEILNFFSIIFGYLSTNHIQKAYRFEERHPQSLKVSKASEKVILDEPPNEKYINLIIMSLGTYSIKPNLLDTGQQQPVEPISA